MSHIEEAVKEIKEARDASCEEVRDAEPEDPLRKYFHDRFYEARYLSLQDLTLALYVGLPASGDEKFFEYYHRFNRSKEQTDQRRQVYRDHEAAVESGTYRDLFLVESEGVRQRLGGWMHRTPNMARWGDWVENVRAHHELRVGESIMREERKDTLFLPQEQLTDVERRTMVSREKKVWRKESVTEWGMWITRITQYGVSRVENGFVGYMRVFLESEEPPYPFTHTSE